MAMGKVKFAERFSGGAVQPLSYVRYNREPSLAVQSTSACACASYSRMNSFQLRLMKTKKEEEMKGIIRRYSGRVSDVGKSFFVRSGIRTHAHRSGLRPERSALDHSAILTLLPILLNCTITLLQQQSEATIESARQQRQDGRVV